jgi:hypothetical protein
MAMASEQKYCMDNVVVASVPLFTPREERTRINFAVLNASVRAFDGPRLGFGCWKLDMKSLADPDQGAPTDDDGATGGVSREA